MQLQGLKFSRYVLFNMKALDSFPSEEAATLGSAPAGACSSFKAVHQYQVLPIPLFYFSEPEHSWCTVLGGFSDNKAQVDPKS